MQPSQGRPFTRHPDEVIRRGRSEGERGAGTAAEDESAQRVRPSESAEQGREVCAKAGGGAPQAPRPPRSRQGAGTVVVLRKMLSVLGRFSAMSGLPSPL